MKTAIAMLVGLALISTALPAQAADLARSRELMSLMKADEIAVGAMKYGLRRKQAEAGLSNAQLDCVDTLSPTQFTDAIADGLTDEEVSAAMAFYRTPAGSRFVEFSVARMSGKSAPQLNEDDLAKVREFAATPAGTKLLKQNLPGTADVVTNKMAQLTGDTIENCGKAKPK
jgi:hypothetical protein